MPPGFCCWAKLTLVSLMSTSLVLPSSMAWSTTGTLPRQRRSFASFPSSTCLQFCLSRQRQIRGLSSVLAVQSRTVDMDDRTAIEDEGDQKELATFEATLKTGQHFELETQKIFNAVFLAVSFGYAAYTIFNIDAGMSRGWSKSEIALRIPLDNWSNYESSLMEKPVFTKTLINVVIYLLGDWLSQTVFQKKDVLDFDVSRTLKNGFIGLCFGPLVHQYYAFSDYILPVEEGLITRLQKICMDQTIYLTVKCSIYICAVGLLSGDDWDTCKQSVKNKIVGIVVTAWKFWPLVHCITYGVIPARHRILWVNSVDLIWNAILASKAQKDQPSDVIAYEAETLGELQVGAAVKSITISAPPAEIARDQQPVGDTSTTEEDERSLPIAQKPLPTTPANGIPNDSDNEGFAVSQENETQVGTSATAKSDHNVAP